MKAVIMRETGGPEVLSYEDVADPEPGEGEVLVRVKAASVNAVDWKYRSGQAEKELPAILGNDISGTVESSNADGFSEGDRVFGFAASGGYAELATTPAAAVALKPDDVSFEDAAAIPVAGLTAWQALFDKGAVADGRRVVIAGAAGGVGHFATQFASMAAAFVIGVGSSRNRDFVLGLGADEYVDYTQQDVTEAVSDIDAAFDAVGGETTASLVPTLREGGILVTIANAPPEAAANERGARAELLMLSPNPEQLTRVAQLIEDDDIRVEIAETFPLTEVQRAHELSESGHVRGKLVLSVG
jgi:NADPH:quinone reductase-like Zn-dependent oxidoreductase